MKLKLVRTHKGRYNARAYKFGIVVSRFNEPLTRQLLDGAVDTLLRHGAREANIRVVWVPGAFEVPLALKKLLREVRLDAAITLSVVIRGRTKHFDQVVTESARGAREVALNSGVPVILGMVSASSAADALERVGLKSVNRGREWALAAIEMADLMQQPFGKGS